MSPVPAIQADQVLVRQGKATLLEGVDLHLQEGEVLAIIGPNGAGKSTLLKALLGLRPLSQGQIAVFGRPLPDDPSTRARLLAYVPQRSALDAPITARALVAMGRFAHRGSRFGWSRQDEAAIEQALIESDCGQLADRDVRSCSGGEQARLLIARALASQAPCLLLDEPGASLDIAHRLRLYALLRRLAAAGKAIALVLHDLGEAQRWADRALLLAGGRVQAEGALSTVLDPQHLAQVYGVEAAIRPGLSFRLRDETS